MASKFSLYIAVFLFFLSWCLPAYEGMIGAGVMLTAFVCHFMIFPIFIVFPVWANVSFLLACKNYQRYPVQSGKGQNYAAITFVLMLIGVISASSKINAGALVWLLSSIFLLASFGFKRIAEAYARILLLALIILMLIGACLLYVYEKKQSRYQSPRSFDLTHYLFKPKDSQVEIPLLTQVQQNNHYRIAQKIPADPQALDLAFLLQEAVELDFGETLYIPSNKDKKLNCSLKPNQQHDLFYPPKYLQDGYAWIRYFNSGDVAVGHPSNAQGAVIYRAKNLDPQHTLLQLIRKSDQHVLYEQKLLVDSGFEKCSYFPKGYKQELNAVFELDAGSLDRKFGSFIPHARLDELEQLTEQCGWQKLAHNTYEFEGKRINFLDTKTFSPQLLCSGKYLAVGSLTEYHAQDIENSLMIETFRRDTLEPVPCGLVSYRLTDSQKQAFYAGKLKMEALKAIQADEFYSQDDRCPVIELHLNDGEVKIDHNFLSKNKE
ncbi:MAG: hypothetical protein WB445_00965 [Acinetobacter sp.]